MKQLTCEMCGSTDLLKQDGVFVCQTCGCKYSVEEAKRMLVEVDGSVQVQNAAQLDNLLKMAKSSYESKNYSKAEDFCNQVIAMDDKNYEAWKLKGQAVNFQISANNQRILEVYNCIMTAYRVLDDENKDNLLKKLEIISILKTCFEGEVEFWLNQFEANRPTDVALTRAKNAYIDAYNKMKAAFEELQLEESKEGYLTNFDNLFIGKCNATCNSAWKSTVGYNYYRDYFGKGIDPFGRSDQRWIITNTDIYRPTKNIWDTFKDETDNLIALLQFAEEQFNDETNPDVMEAIYSNIAYFEECVISSGSWKITQGYTSNWDQYKSVGWHEEYGLADSAKAARRAIVNEYKDKEKRVPDQVRTKQKAKEEKERKEKIEQYWEEHPDEKDKLDAEQAEIQKQIFEINAQILSVDKDNAPKIAELEKALKEKTSTEIEVEKQDRVVRDLETQRSNCGIFKGKEKKAITERLDTIERPRLEELKKKAEAEKKAQQSSINSQITMLKNDRQDLRDELSKLKKRDSEITTILTQDR